VIMLGPKHLGSWAQRPSLPSHGLSLTQVISLQPIGFSRSQDSNIPLEEKPFSRQRRKLLQRIVNSKRKETTEIL
jgi:hypothetical protein